MLRVCSLSTKVILAQPEGPAGCGAFWRVGEPGPVLGSAGAQVRAVRGSVLGWGRASFLWHEAQVSARHIFLTLDGGKEGSFLRDRLSKE